MLKVSRKLSKFWESMESLWKNKSYAPLFVTLMYTQKLSLLSYPNRNDEWFRKPHWNDTVTHQYTQEDFFANILHDNNNVQNHP